jgi:dTDP-4-dehydrorhamnose 3,5-epimerase
MPKRNLPPERKLPSVFVEGSISGVIMKPIEFRVDQRGWLAEIYRQDELPADQYPVMAYVSETLPGVARGPHEHVSQTDYFAFIGPGNFVLYLWDIRAASASWGKRMKMIVGESNKQVVIVPPGVVHAYKNVGDTPSWVINEPNRLYAGDGRKDVVDEIRHENLPNSSFLLD